MQKLEAGVCKVTEPYKVGQDQCHVVGQQFHTKNYRNTKSCHLSINSFRDIEIFKKLMLPESNTYVSPFVAGETKTVALISAFYCHEVKFC